MCLSLPSSQSFYRQIIDYGMSVDDHRVSLMVKGGGERPGSWANKSITHNVQLECTQPRISINVMYMQLLYSHNCIVPISVIRM